MFNDERINFEIGKLKKMLIILSLVLSIIFLCYKFICGLYYDINIWCYITEIVILVTSIIVLIRGKNIKVDVKDELYYQSKAEYYNKTFKILLYISFITFAIIMPTTLFSEVNQYFSSNFCINTIMAAALFLGYGYLRLKKIYFNYSFIENDTKTYYKNVFINILKMIGFFGMIYGISLFISLFYWFKTNILEIIIALLIAFVITVVSNGIYYLFISFLERLFYKEEDNKKITTPTVILITISTLLIFVYIIVVNAFYSLSNEFLNYINKSQAEYIAMILTYKTYITEWCRYASVLTVTFLVTDLCKKNEVLMKKMKYIVGSFIFFIIFNIVYSRIFPNVITIVTRFIIYNELSEDSSLLTGLSYIQSIVPCLNCLYYIIISMIIFVNIRNNKVLKVINIIWIINNVFIIIAYLLLLMEKLYLISIILYILVSVISLIYTLYFYFNKENTIIDNNCNIIG